MTSEVELYYRTQPDGEGQVHREIVLDGISQVGRQECNIERQAVGELRRMTDDEVEAASAERFCGHCTHRGRLALESTPVED